MALTANEIKRGQGRVQDVKTGALMVVSVSTALIGQRFDTDGRLVILQRPTGDPGAKVT